MKLWKLRYCLQDNCQWYRRWKGGRWVLWADMWTQETKMPDGTGMWFICRRGFQGFDLADGGKVYEWDQLLNWNSEYLDAKEDWRKPCQPG